MSKKTNSGNKGTDGTTTNEKGESQQSKQKGATTVSGKKNKHTKDESGGAEKNKTKKQQNSI